MPVLNIYVGPWTHDALSRAAREQGRSIEAFAEDAVAEAALAYERGRPSGPARPPLRFQTPEDGLAVQTR